MLNSIPNFLKNVKPEIISSVGWDEDFRKFFLFSFSQSIEIVTKEISRLVSIQSIKLDLASKGNAALTKQISSLEQEKNTSQAALIAQYEHMVAMANASGDQLHKISDKALDVHERVAKQRSNLLQNQFRFQFRIHNPVFPRVLN